VVKAIDPIISKFYFFQVIAHILGKVSSPLTFLAIDLVSRLLTLPQNMAISPPFRARLELKAHFNHPFHTKKFKRLPKFLQKAHF
jgi:hypothetical protein